MNAFYTFNDGHYVPGDLATSPWDPKLQGGVALAGLCAHAIGEVGSPVPMQEARLTIDILQKVPRQPLSVTMRALREGQRLQVIECSLQAGEQLVVRGTCLRVRNATSPRRLQAPTRAFTDHAEGVKKRVPWVETLSIDGDPRRDGPGASWVHFLCDVVAGHPLQPFEAAAMVADFGSGIGPLCRLTEWTFANVDISLHLARLPRGEWLLVDSASESAGLGMGIANTRLGDREGMFGSAHQTTFIEPRTSRGGDNYS